GGRVGAGGASGKGQSGGRVADLMTRDHYPAYETAILQAYGQEVTTTPGGKPSRRMAPAKVPPPGLNYATVEKRREKGRVVEILTRGGFGTMAAMQAAGARSAGRRAVNTPFLERRNATRPHPNPPKGPQTDTFSNDSEGPQ